MSILKKIWLVGLGVISVMLLGYAILLLAVFIVGGYF